MMTSPAGEVITHPRHPATPHIVDHKGPLRTPSLTLPLGRVREGVLRCETTYDSVLGNKTPFLTSPEGGIRTEKRLYPLF